MPNMRVRSRDARNARECKLCSTYLRHLNYYALHTRNRLVRTARRSCAARCVRACVRGFFFGIFSSLVRFAQHTIRTYKLFGEKYMRKVERNAYARKIIMLSATTCVGPSPLSRVPRAMFATIFTCDGETRARQITARYV